MSAGESYWIPGKVRVRASAPDPLCGLRGHAYIAARGLGKPAARLPADDEAERAAARANLIKAINQRPALPGEGNTNGHADGMRACTAPAGTYGAPLSRELIQAIKQLLAEPASIRLARMTGAADFLPIPPRRYAIIVPAPSGHPDLVAQLQAQQAINRARSR
ncbi:MAG: hypothetical protein WBG17_05240 [Burkholderiaceae bacterium]